MKYVGQTMTKVIEILKVKKGEPTKIKVEGVVYVREQQQYGVKK